MAHQVSLAYLRIRYGINTFQNIPAVCHHLDVNGWF